MSTNTKRQKALKAITSAAVASIFGELIDKAPFVSEAELNELDGELIQRGFDAVLLGHRPDLGLEQLNRTGVIKAIIPDLVRIIGFGGWKEGHKDLWWHTKLVVKNTPPRIAVRWAALFHDVGKPLTIRKDGKEVSFHGHEHMGVRIFRQCCITSVLFPDADLRKRVENLIMLLGDVEAYSPDWTDTAVRRLRKKFDSEDLWYDTIDLARADVTTRDKQKRARIRDRMNELVYRASKLLKEDEESLPVIPKGIGTAIIEDLGVPPGPRVGELRKLLDAQVKAGNLEREQPIEYYVEYLRNNAQNTP